MSERMHEKRRTPAPAGPAGVSLGRLAVALALCLAGGSQAAPGAAEPAAAAPDAAGTATVPDAPVASTVPANTVKATNTRTFTFRQLGAKLPLQLRGVQGYYTLPFAVRADEVVARARLHLKYSWSPALLEDMSHLAVRVNDEVAATLPLPKDKAGTTVEADVDIPPQLVSEFSRLGIELVGHYAKGCEDPTHSSLWAAVSNESTLRLDVAHVDTPNDLAALPRPFFDRREIGRMELPVVMPAAPDLKLLSAAGTVASWFGALAGYRGAHFSARDSLPGKGNALVLVAGDAALAALGVQVPGGTIKGPTVAVATHPHDPDGKLLLVLGRDEDEVRTAATALVVGSKSFSGQVVAVKDVQGLQPRRPYDAPNWLPADRAVRFGELTAPDVLGVAGESPDLIRVAFQLPPDLFGWRSKGIPIDLRYRYTPRATPDKSTLNINVNQRFLQAIPLHTESGSSKFAQLFDRLLPTAAAALPGGSVSASAERLYLPTFMLPVHNELQLHYFYDKPKQDTCHSAPIDNVRSEVDPDSTLDISSFPHYLAMPDLAAFANSGFPFTRMADLSDSAVVLPDRPGVPELNTFLALMGRMGAATGYPAYNATLVHAGEVSAVAGKDLLLIGTVADQPLLRQWNGHLPISLQGQVRKVSLSDVVYRVANGDLDRRIGVQPTTGVVNFSGDGSDGMIAGFESPLAPGRSVVAVSASRPEGLDKVVEALLDPEKLKEVQGSATLVRQDQVDSVVAEQDYFVGHLPRMVQVQWFFSRYPVLLALAAFAAAALMSSALYLLLRDRARRRLHAP